MRAFSSGAVAVVFAGEFLHCLKCQPILKGTFFFFLLYAKCKYYESPMENLYFAIVLSKINILNKKKTILCALLIHSILRLDPLIPT